MMNHQNVNDFGRNNLINYSVITFDNFTDAIFSNFINNFSNFFMAF